MARVRPYGLHRPLPGLQRTFLSPFSFNRAYRKGQYNHLRFTEEKTEVWGAYRPIGSVDQTRDMSPHLLVLSLFLRASPLCLSEGNFGSKSLGAGVQGGVEPGASPVSGAQ